MFLLIPLLIIVFVFGSFFLSMLTAVCTAFFALVYAIFSGIYHFIIRKADEIDKEDKEDKKDVTNE